jgi:Ni2+-binding GTPase involved in maturation of urease and hydrogenase
MATKRIAVLGGPRCGKTTLIQHLYVEMKISGLDVGLVLVVSLIWLESKTTKCAVPSSKC